MKPELEAKIRHLITFTQSCLALITNTFGMIGIISRNNAVVMSQEYRILRGFHEERLVHALEKSLRVVSYGTPQTRVQPGKQ